MNRNSKDNVGHGGQALALETTEFSSSFSFINFENLGRYNLSNLFFLISKMNPKYLFQRF